MAWTYRSRLPLYVAMIVGGVAAATITVVVSQWQLAPAMAWTVIAVIFNLWIWYRLGSADAERTREHAHIDEPGHRTVEIMLLIASVVSLAAVAVVIVGSHQSNEDRKVWLAMLALISVVASWFLIQNVFTLRYASMYYSTDAEGKTVGGISFNQEEPPRYSDFLYMSLSLGMTYQVSDTSFQNSEIRLVALRHSLLAYLFGVGIIASTINILLSVAS